VPIKETVSMTLSPPIRIFAIVGVLAAAGLAAFFFVAGRTAGESLSTPTTTATPTQTTPVTQPTTRPSTSANRPRVNGAPKVTRSGFPVPVDRALRRKPVVVVVVYMPGSSVDAVVRREARAAAIASRAGYVAVSALSERLVRPLVAKTGILPDPAVVVVRRPGLVTKTLGVTDRATVAQAVAQARRR
jgi:hypothetical protein